jgi:hypothetical protein
MRRGFGLIWVLVTAIVIATVGVIAYQAGWSDGFAQHVPSGAASAPYPYPYYGAYGPHIFGFGWIFGLLFFLFFLFILFRVARFGRWGGGWGHGGPGWSHQSGGVPPAIEERMKEWHQRAHSEPAAAAPGTAPPPDQRA